VVEAGEGTVSCCKVSSAFALGADTLCDTGHG
jgi:hypothetical protein